MPSTLLDEGRFERRKAEAADLFALPFPELIHRAMETHRRHHDPCRIEACALLSIRTGACPEDCAYCSQSARHESPATPSPLMDVTAVRQAAREARRQGAVRLCLGASGRAPKDREIDRLCAMIAAVKEEGLEACATLGLLTPAQARRLKAAGLDWYNHNIDTSPDHYPNIVSTHTFEDRLKTLRAVAEAGLNVCCGGIIGLGESREDRIAFIAALAALPGRPRSVPVNVLEPMPGTPLAEAPPPDPLELVRTIAVARLLLPEARIRLSAGRRYMSDELQALCYLAGANSIFLGPRLLTAGNADPADDAALFERLGLRLQEGAS